MTRSSMSIRVLLIDDHPLALLGLVAALARDPGVEVVGTAGTGADGLRLAAELRPDVAVLDLHLPDMDGVCVIADLRRVVPEARTLIVSASEQADDILRAMEVGAAGYLSKRVGPEEVRQAVIAVHGGGSVISPGLAAVLLRGCAGTSETAPERSLLTEREQEILRLLVRGRTDREIAATLHVSTRTVQNQLAHVRRKTGFTGARSSPAGPGTTRRRRDRDRRRATVAGAEQLRTG